MQDLDSWSIEIGETQASVGRPITLEGKPVGQLLMATAQIAGVELRGQEFFFDHKARRAAEWALESLARILALEHRTKLQIASPVPYIGFVGDEVYIEGLVGRKFSGPVVKGIGPWRSGKAGILSGEILHGLVERTDGVSLLVEALSHENALGQYLQIIRLFERAFAVPAGKTVQFLVPFLTDARCPHGFMKKEIHEWIEARPKAAHADKRKEFLLEADTRPWVGRMMEAAYDVVLNKSNWRVPDSERRTLWKATSGSSDANSGIFATQGADASLSVQAVDGFMAYPVLLGGGLEDALPKGAWLSGDKDGGTLKLSGR